MNLFKFINLPTRVYQIFIYVTLALSFVCAITNNSVMTGIFDFSAGFATALVVKRWMDAEDKAKEK
jgi:hypothetical protein